MQTTCTQQQHQKKTPRVSQPVNPPLSFFSRSRSRYLQTLHHTGWGTTALCKLPSSNLDAPSPPSLFSSAAPSSSSVTPASLSTNQRREEQGPANDITADQSRRSANSSPLLSGSFNSQWLVSDWLVFIATYIYNQRRALFAVVFFSVDGVSPQTAHVSRNLLCTCVQLLSQVAVATVLFEGGCLQGRNCGEVLVLTRAIESSTRWRRVLGHGD